MDRKRRLLVKIGRASLMGPERRLSQHIFDDVANQIVQVMEMDIEVALVTSGAIQSGIETLSTSSRYISSDFPAEEQASIGSIPLMNRWTRAFGQHQIIIGQILLTHSNLSNHYERIGLAARIENMLKRRVVATFNANDMANPDETRLYELGISENDQLTRMIDELVPFDDILFITESGGIFGPLDGENHYSWFYKEINGDSLPQHLFDDNITTIGAGGPGKKVQEASRCRKEGGRVAISGLENRGIVRFASGENTGTLISDREVKVMREKQCSS